MILSHSRNGPLVLFLSFFLSSTPPPCRRAISEEATGGHWTHRGEKEALPPPSLLPYIKEEERLLQIKAHLLTNNVCFSKLK